MKLRILPNIDPIGSLRTMQQIHREPREPIIFRYEHLSAPDRAAVRQATREIRTNVDNTIRSIWEIGRKLVEVRWKLKENLFGAWLQSEFAWSRRTAYHYINVYEAFPQIDRQHGEQIDIDLSALYLLAAPSTPSEMRSDFFDRAQSGERVRHKDVKASLQQVKIAAPSDEIQVVPEIADLPLASPRHILASDLEDEVGNAEDRSVSALYPGWNSIDRDFSLFWGDISSSRFNELLPDAAFVLATPSNEWQQAWLIGNTHSSIALDKSQLDRKIVSGFLSVIAERNKAIVFPWLPKWQIVKIALDLQLQIYAADADLRRCERVLLQLGFDLQRIERIWG